MFNKKRISYYFFVILLLLIVIIWGLVKFALRDPKVAIKNVTQNALAFVDPHSANQALLSPEKQQALAKDYLAHYFSPWTGKKIMYSDAEIKQYQQSILSIYQHYSGWGFNQHRYAPLWIKNIVHNIQLSSFPNYHQRGIVVHATHLRVLPTQDAVFENLWRPGKGYPFDELQQAWLVPNTPVLMLQLTQDGEWVLVLTHNQVGWVERSSIGNVSQSFMRQWQAAQQYVTAVKDNAPLVDGHEVKFVTRIGAIYPLIKNANGHYQVMVAVDNDQTAVIKLVTLTDDAATPWPFLMTPNHVATLANQMMGDPYGWGELYGHRDCSATMIDLFAGFGIWLPRSSADQAVAWHKVSFKGLSTSAKEQTIIHQGIPFMTLLDLHGHVMLYIGSKGGKAYAFHDVWGIHTITNGRLVIGRTIISPVSLGSQYWNTRNLLTSMHGMTLLGNPGVVLTH